MTFLEMILGLMRFLFHFNYNKNCSVRRAALWSGCKSIAATL